MGHHENILELTYWKQWKLQAAKYLYDPRIQLVPYWQADLCPDMLSDINKFRLSKCGTQAVLWSLLTNILSCKHRFDRLIYASSAVIYTAFVVSLSRQMLVLDVQQCKYIIVTPMNRLTNDRVIVRVFKYLTCYSILPFSTIANVGVFVQSSESYLEVEFGILG